MAVSIPLSPASAAIWRYMVNHENEWFTAPNITPLTGATFRTSARLLKLFVEAGLVEVRKTHPAWTYRHAKAMRAKARALATELDGLIS
jgi:hypothetical protein